MASDQALTADKVVRALKSFTSSLSQPEAQPEFRSLQACLFLRLEPLNNYFILVIVPTEFVPTEIGFQEQLLYRVLAFLKFTLYLTRRVVDVCLAYTS